MEKSLWQNRTIAVLITVAGILVPSTLFGGQVGGYSGAYLRPAVGASAVAMGGAYTASPDYLAPWWNPAVLANLREKMFSIGTGMRSMGRSDLFSSFEFRVPPRLGMGIVLLYRGDPFLNDLYDEAEFALPRASYTTLTGKVAVSYYVSKKLSAGASIGVHYQRLPTSIDENNRWAYSSATGIGAFDIGMNYKLNQKVAIALNIKDLFAQMTWKSTEEYNSILNDRPLPSLTLAASYSDSLRKKPFTWNTDLKAYIFDGEFNMLTFPECYLSTGAEWQYWKSFYLRAGLGDILINRDIIRHTDDYFSEFPFKLTAGFSLHLSRLNDGMFLNYGVATDKAWSGVDQQIDITIRF